MAPPRRLRAGIVLSLQQPRHHQPAAKRSAYFPENHGDGCDDSEEPSSIWEERRPAPHNTQPGDRLLPPPLPPGARLLAPLQQQRPQPLDDPAEEEESSGHHTDGDEEASLNPQQRLQPSSSSSAAAIRSLPDSGALSPLLLLHPRACRRVHAHLVGRLQQASSSPRTLVVRARVCPTAACLRRLPPHTLQQRNAAAPPFSLMLEGAVEEAVEAVGDEGERGLLNRCFLAGAEQRGQDTQWLPVVVVEDEGGDETEDDYRTILQWARHTLSTTVTPPCPLPLALAPLRLRAAVRGADTLSLHAIQLVPRLALRLTPVAAAAPFRWRGGEGGSGTGGFLVPDDGDGGGLVAVGMDGASDEQRQRAWVGVWVSDEQGAESEDEEEGAERLLRSPALWAMALRLVMLRCVYV